MAFVKAVIEARKASIGTGLKIALRKARTAPAAMNISITASLGKSFDWSDGDKLEVLLGEGEHHGLIRLRKNNSAGQAAVSWRETAKGKWVSIRLGHQPKFVDRTESALWCQWECVEDGWIEVVLPRWSDETAPRRTLPGASLVGERPAEPIRPRANVTAALMGDPPPGRREMLDQIDKASRK